MRRTLLFAGLAAVVLCAITLAVRQGLTHQPEPPNGDGKPEAAAKLPIAQVVLFNSGVGYFQREGQIDGDAHVDLSFQASDINDLLKSLVLQDAGGGKVGVVSYDSFDPIDKTLHSFALDLNNNPTLSQILNQARGEKVEVVRQQPGAEPLTLFGTIVGLEVHTQTLMDHVEQLNLLTADGLRGVPLAQVQKVRFLNPTLDDEFRRALEVLARSHDSQKKSLRVNFTGNGKRSVKVGYVVERPIWKTSYRLSLGDKGKLHLQGWAMVENTSDDDWNGVRMMLVTGRPISFQMNLYQPLYVPRPWVEPELFASLRPPVYAGDMSIPSVAAFPRGRPPQGGASENARSAVQKKLIPFEMRDAPWKKVLEWLSDQTGLPVIASYTPQGTFSLTPPRINGKPRQYTLPEIMDTLNDALQAEKNNNYIIIRRPTSMMLYPADQKIPPELLPFVAPEDLEKYGKSEMVKTRISLKRLDAAALAKEVEKHLGPFGMSVALSDSNELYLQDKVQTLRNIRDMVARIDRKENPNQQPFLAGSATFKTYRVSDGNAEAVAKTLSAVLKPSRSLHIEATNGNTLLVYANPEDHFLIQKFLVGDGLTDVPPTPALILLSQADAKRVSDTVNKMYVGLKGGGPYVEADVSRNGIIVKGTPEQVKEVRDVIEVLDGGKASGGSGVLGPNSRVINQGEGSATLAEMFNPKHGVIPMATAKDVGDSYRYVIDQKITIARQKSAMVPIVNQPIEGAKISIYNPSVHASFPLLGLRIKNTSGHPLMQGPITVYEEGVYAGDTRVLDLQPNEERLVSYAVDLGTEVVSSTQERPGPDMTFKVGGNNLTAHYKLRQTQTYTIKNRSTQDRTVLIEHPIRGDWKLVADEKKDKVEKSRDVYRFPVKVPAGKTVPFAVSEEQDRRDAVAIFQADKDTPPRCTLAFGIEVRQVTTTRPEELLSVKVVKGVVQAEYRQRETRAYFIQNNSGEERTFTIDYLIRPDWQLIGADGKIEKGPGVHRVVVKVAEGKTATTSVAEEHVEPYADHSLASLDESKLREFLQSKVTPVAVRQAIEKTLAFQAETDKLGRQLKEFQAKQTEMSEDQARVRENLKILPQSSAPYKRFLDKFDKQETQIEELQAQIRQVQSAIEGRRKSYEDYINTLTVP